MNVDLVALITAITTLVGLIVTSLLQYRKNKADAKNIDSQSKKTESDAAAQLIDKALAISKQEIDTLRTVNVDIKAQLDESHKTVKELEEKVRKLTEDNENLTRSNDILMNKVFELESKMKECLAKLGVKSND